MEVRYDDSKSLLSKVLCCDQTHLCEDDVDEGPHQDDNHDDPLPPTHVSDGR